MTTAPTTRAPRPSRAHVSPTAAAAEYHEDTRAGHAQHESGPSWKRSLDATAQCVLWRPYLRREPLLPERSVNFLGPPATSRCRTSPVRTRSAWWGCRQRQHPFLLQTPPRQAVSVHKADLTRGAAWCSLQDTEGLVRTTQAGQGGDADEPPVSGTTSYAYRFLPARVARLRLRGVPVLGRRPAPDTNDSTTTASMGFLAHGHRIR